MMSSTVGLGLKKLMTRGQFVSGLVDIGTFSVSPFVNMWEGTRIKKAYRQQIDKIQDPKLRAKVETIVRAGGRERIDVFYYNQQLKALEKTFKGIIKDRDLGTLVDIAKLPFHLTGALFEVLAKPIMEWYVPTGKLGLFSKLAEYEMERAERGEITDEQLTDRLCAVWDSVDNRMGQLVYDNLFWHKAFKDSLMLGIRSVGWNLGSWREYAGAGVDLLTVNQRMKRGDKFLSHKMAYAIGALIVYSILGAVIQYLLTGKEPEEPKDYFFPKTGRKNPDGSDERLSLPTYAKDIYSYSQRPMQTARNKVHPLVGLVHDQVTNKDFFNVEIDPKGDGVYKSMIDRANYTINYAKPFSFKNYEKMQRTEESGLRSWAVSITGIVSAPSYVTRSPAQKLMYRYLAEQIPDKTRTKEQYERSEYRKALKNRIRKGEPVDLAEAKKVLGKESYNRTLKEAKLPAFADSFKRLSFGAALNVYAIANKNERKQVIGILKDKYSRARNVSKEELDMYRELLRETVKQKKSFIKPKIIR